MSTTSMIAILGGVSLVLVAGACAILAPGLQKLFRILAGLLFGALGLFCVLGFAGAMEPGDNHLAWRIGYAVLFLAGLFAVGRLTMSPDSSDTTEDLPRN